MTLGTEHLIEYGVEDNAESNLSAGISAAVLSIPVVNGTVFPATISGAATSAGTNILLNSTGIQAKGVAIGNFIRNLTDGSFAVITGVNTDSVNTLPLYGGSGNTWDDNDEWVVGSFVVTLVQFNTTNDPDSGVAKREKTLIDTRSGNTLTVNTNGRGFDGSTAGSFDTNDNVFLFVKVLEYRDMIAGVKNNMDRIQTIEDELPSFLKKDGTISMDNDADFTGRNNADSANIDLYKLTTSDILEFQTLPRLLSSRVISDDQDLIDKQFFDDNSTDTFSVTYGETIAIGDVLFFDSADSKWKLADQSVAAKVRGRVMAVEAGILDDVKRVRKGGVATGLSGLTIGVMHYLGAGGALATSPGSTTAVPVGIPLSATTILLTWGKKVAAGSGASQSGTTSETITTGFRVENLILMGRVDVSASDKEVGTIHFINGIAIGGFLYEAEAAVDSARIGTVLSCSGSTLTASSFTDTSFDIDTTQSSGAGSSSIKWIATGE